MPKSLVRSRLRAFAHQSGRCYYCGMSMWTNNPAWFANQHGLTLKQAKRFQCTGEHLTARQDGGSSARSNIVAACLFCNRGRHRQKSPLSPDRYREMVRNRMASGKWHSGIATRLPDHSGTRAIPYRLTSGYRVPATATVVPSLLHTLRPWVLPAAPQPTKP